MPALLLGSIGVLVETSTVQRDAFNRAFREVGLDWSWSDEDLKSHPCALSDRARIAQHAAASRLRVDADALARRKSEFVRTALAHPVTLRPGVADTIAEARTKGWRIGLVSAASEAIVDAVLRATHLGRDSFHAVVTRADRLAPKPAPDSYLKALLELEILPHDAIAVENTADGLRAAKAAGLACLAFPDERNASADFAGAAIHLDRLALHPEVRTG